MGYFDLKRECGKKGLGGKGTAAVLRARLKGTEEKDQASKPEVKAIPPQSTAPQNNVVDERKTTVAASSEELAKFLPTAINTPKVDNSRFEPWLTKERLAALDNKLSLISVGKGKFRFDLDYKKSAFQVEFSGRPLGLNSTTLVATDEAILKEARFYFNARVSVGKNAQGSRI